MQNEVYCTWIMMLVHLGFIRIPGHLDKAYSNPGHTMEGALNSLRWLAPDFINNLGSDPEATVKMRYNQVGLPKHLVKYSKGIPREIQNARGDRTIARRLTIITSIKKTTTRGESSKKSLPGLP